MLREQLYVHLFFYVEPVAAAVDVTFNNTDSKILQILEISVYFLPSWEAHDRLLNVQT